MQPGSLLRHFDLAQCAIFVFLTDVKRMRSLDNAYHANGSVDMCEALRSWRD